MPLVCDRGISTINIAICDDEKKDIVHLKSILQEVMDKYSMSYDIQEYESGESLMQAASLFHLIFLDIVMNEESGIEIGKHIHRKNRSTKIIFQTNFGNYCKEAMNRTHAFAFLEKPLKAPAVEEQIKEFFEDSEGMQDLLMDFHNVRYSLDGKDVVKSILSIPVKEIVYFEYIKMQKEIKIVTKSTEYIYTEAMKYLNTLVGVVNLAKGHQNRKKEFANALDYLETWDDSDSITAVNAQKRFETFTKMVA